jgi:hypothetical protein
MAVEGQEDKRRKKRAAHEAHGLWLGSYPDTLRFQAALEIKRQYMKLKIFRTTYRGLAGFAELPRSCDRG